LLTIDLKGYNMQRKIINTVQGVAAVDGAGVRLTRVLGRSDVEAFDPFLMLDSFDSLNPDDYVRGFPMHPHRGIETITYLIEGRIDHEDSLGNKGTISSGQAQWMTAGGGILHQEMPKETPRMLGFQLWLNLPSQDKMTPTQYYDITQEMVPAVQEGEATVRVISGEYKGSHGARPRHVQATLYDITLPAGASIELSNDPAENVFVFTILGEALIDGHNIREKTAVLFGEGDKVTMQSPQGTDARVIYYAAKPLKEPISWGGPIVMNTREELNRAFDELQRGTFLQH